jgi:cell division septation protein DedD
LVDVINGQTLVQESHATKFREAGVPLSPLSIVSDVVKTWMNLSETQRVRAIDDLGRNLAEKIPDLPAIRPPSPGQNVAAASLSPPPPAMPPVNESTTTPAAHRSQPLTTVAVAALSIPAPVSSATENISPLLPSRPATQEHYRLQVAAFRTYEDAQRMVRLLRDKGYPAMITQTGTAENMWNQVILGPFPSRTAALKVGRAIRKIVLLSPIVIARPRH